MGEDVTMQRRAPGDSPINVGGGGGAEDDPERLRSVFVDIQFDHDDYVPDPDDRDLYANELVQLWKFIIDGTEYPVTSDVTITCLNPNSNKTAKIVVSKSPFGVKFNPHDFPYDHQSRKHTSNKTNKPRIVIKVENETATFFDDPNGAMVTITALNT